MKRREKTMDNLFNAMVEVVRNYAKVLQEKKEERKEIERLVKKDVEERDEEFRWKHRD